MVDSSGVLVLVAGMREGETKKEKEHGVKEAKKKKQKRKTRGGGDWERWVNRWGGSVQGRKWECVDECVGRGWMRRETAFCFYGLYNQRFPFTAATVTCVSNNALIVLYITLICVSGGNLWMYKSSFRSTS